jgi:hypothetical protein
MDPKRLLLQMIKQLYDDIKFVTQQNPTQIVDDDGSRCYNSLLGKARKYFPYDEFVGDFSDWQPRSIKYKDALVVVGQLCSMITALMEASKEGSRDRVMRPTNMAPTPAPARHQGSPRPMPAGGGHGSTSPSSTQNRMINRHTPAPTPIPDDLNPRPIRPRAPQELRKPGADKDLYGTDPVVRNNDGTIPFTLD